MPEWYFGWLIVVVCVVFVDWFISFCVLVWMLFCLLFCFILRYLNGLRFMRCAVDYGLVACLVEFEIRFCAAWLVWLLMFGFSWVGLVTSLGVCGLIVYVLKLLICLFDLACWFCLVFMLWCVVLFCFCYLVVWMLFWVPARLRG